MTAGPEIRTLAFVDPLHGASAATDGVIRDLLPQHDGLEIEKSDRFLFLFRRPVDAVTFCLECHRVLQDSSESIRAAVHLGEVVLRENPPEHVERGAKPLELEGTARHTAGRLLSLAAAGQTLLTRAAFELARRALVGEEGELTWLAHGDYRFEGPDEIVEVFEVGAPGVAPLAPPPPREQVRRASIVEDEEETWRPAAGREIPGRAHWLLEERLDGEDTPGRLETWRACHAKTHERRRVYLGRTEADRSVLERQVETLSRLHREVGRRDDLPQLLEWSLEEPPYVMEISWIEAPTLETVEIGTAQRLDLAVRIADVVAAIHDAEVLMGSLAPRRIRVEPDADEIPRPRWAGGLEFRPVETAREGGRAEDVRELGILTYRLVAGDLSLPWAPFWERDVDDELLREDLAAATDRDPDRRITAAELARRLRALDERRERREAQRRERERTELRRRRWRQAGFALWVLLTLVMLAWVLM